MHSMDLIFYHYTNMPHHNDLFIITRWRSGAMGRASDMRSTDREFKHHTRGQKLHNNLGQVVHTYVFSKQYNLVPAKGP